MKRAAPATRPGGAREMTEKVLAATLIAPKQFEIRDHDMPEIPPDGGLLRIERCGVCGSDVSG
jgi:D-arabinose 1-dehydrogenase-like Zn-dependent alcohol dehydrogenase